MFWQTILLLPHFLAPLSQVAAPEEATQRQIVNEMKFTDKPFEELSHQHVTEWGEKALRIKKEKWKHVESDHFILHYQAQDVRDRVMKEAEFYYWKIKTDLKLANDLAEHKSHIFIFEDQARWRQFQANIDLQQIGGVTIGHEFYCYYPKGRDKEFSGTLAHEMTHLVFNRFFRGLPPLWLNEGFAEYQAEKAYRSLYSQTYNRKNKDPGAVRAVNFLEMTTWKTYPGDFDSKLTQGLYIKSQLAVEVLIEKGGPERFVQFTNALIQNHLFEPAFKKHYTETFQSYEKFLKELDRKEKRL